MLFASLVSLLEWEGSPLQRVMEGGEKQKDSDDLLCKIPTREDSFIETDPRYAKFMGTKQEV